MRPNSPLAVRKAINHYAQQPEPTEHDPGKTGVIVNVIERELRTADPKAHLEQVRAMRHLVLSWLFTPDDQPMRDKIGMSELTPQQVYGMWRWLSPGKAPDFDVWLTRPEFRDELKEVLARAQRDWLMTGAMAMGDLPFIPIGDILRTGDDDNHGGYIVHRNLLPKVEQLNIDFHPGE